MFDNSDQHEEFTFPVSCLFNLSALLPSLGTHLCDCNSVLLRQLQLHCDPSVTLQLHPTAYTCLQFQAPLYCLVLKKKTIKPCVLVKPLNLCLCVRNRAHVDSQVSIYKWFFNELLRIFVSAQFHIIEISEFFWLLLKQALWKLYLTLKDVTGLNHFSNQLTFFFSADAHEMRPQLSNYTVKSRRYAGICPLWDSLKSFFLWDCLHMRETILFWSQSSWANNEKIVLQLTQ